MPQMNAVDYMIFAIEEFLADGLVVHLKWLPMSGENSRITLFNVPMRLIHAIEILAIATKLLLIVLPTIDLHINLVFFLKNVRSCLKFVILNRVLI